MPTIYKVFNSDRSVRKALVANSFKDFIKKGKEKLGYSSREAVKVVLDCDGTQVGDEEYFDTLPKGTAFILLKKDESWTWHSHSDAPELDLPDGQESRNTDDILKLLRQDITKIITLDKQELQMVVDMKEEDLAGCIDRPLTEAVRIQNRCQRYLDELQDSQEAMDLIRLIQSNKQSSQDQSQDSFDGQPPGGTDSHSPDGTTSEQNDGSPGRPKRKRKKTDS